MLPAVAAAAALLAPALDRARRDGRTGRLLALGAAVVAAASWLGGAGVAVRAAVASRDVTALWLFGYVLFAPLVPWAWVFMTPPLPLGALTGWLYGRL